MVVALMVAVGLALVVAGVWLLAGTAVGLVAAGVALLVAAWLTNEALPDDAQEA